MPGGHGGGSHGGSGSHGGGGHSGSHGDWHGRQGFGGGGNSWGLSGDYYAGNYGNIYGPSNCYYNPWTMQTVCYSQPALNNIGGWWY
jgi:hypothetical protein